MVGGAAVTGGLLCLDFTVAGGVLCLDFELAVGCDGREITVLEKLLQHLRNEETR